MPRIKYPRDWVATGHGSYREIREGEFELKFRDENGERHLILPMNADEAATFIEMKTNNRRRMMAGLPGVTGWHEALKMYAENLKAEGVKEKYVEESVTLLKSVMDSADVQPSEIQAVHLDIWINKIARQLRDPSEHRPKGCEGWARTANKKTAMVSAFFTWLHMRVLMDGRLVPTKRFKETKQVRYTPPAEDYGKVWAICEPEIRDLMHFILFTTCRFGEAAKMKRTDMSSAGLWIVRQRKGKNDLELDFPGLLIEIVLRQPTHKDGLVWHKWTVQVPGSRYEHRFKSGQVIDSPWFSKVLRERCKRAGVRHFTAHGLRHAAASWLRTAGVEKDTIKELLGHANVKTTEIYIHGNVRPAVRNAQQKLIELCTAACIRAAKNGQNDAAQSG